MMTFYGYDRCSTCRKAKKFLADRKILFDDVDITTSPPSKKLLNHILAAGEYSINQLFNTSGQLYRQMNIKEVVKESTTDDLIDLLSQHGRLIKRPIITDGKHAVVGFSEERMQKLWG